MTDLASQAARAAAELQAGVAAIAPAQMQALAQALTRAPRIVLYGCGREGLMLRALAMRLHHLGKDAHMQGDMSCPPVGPGDLLLVASGPGRLSTVAALIGQARAAGAHTACLTAEPDGPDPRACDIVLTIPVQTMARDQTRASSVLPMGSVFEGALFLLSELLVLDLRDRLGETPESMRARHANLE